MSNYFSSVFQRIPFPVCRFLVQGKSMDPTIPEGATVLVFHFAYFFTNPQKGEIVVCKHPVTGRMLLKRIDRIINDRIFVVGDNKKMSTDSREFGSLDKAALSGRVFAIL